MKSNNNNNNEKLNTINKVTMESLKVKDLREIAKSKGLKCWSKLRKSDLISFIMVEEEKQERLRIKLKRREKELETY